MILRKYWWLLIIAVVVTIIFVFALGGQLPDLTWNSEKNTELLGVVFAKLFIIGALLDQFIAVFFPEDDTDRDMRSQAQNTLSVIKDSEKTMRRQMLSQQLQGANAINMATFTATLNQNANQKQLAEKTIADTNAKRSSFVRLVAFGIGLILAVSGITILRDFINLTPNELQHKIISFMDIIFTAAVLSGGTSGIDQLLRVVKDSWKKT